MILDFWFCFNISFISDFTHIQLIFFLTFFRQEEDSRDLKSFALLLCSNWWCSHIVSCMFMKAGDVSKNKIIRTHWSFCDFSSGFFLIFIDIQFLVPPMQPHLRSSVGHIACVCFSSYMMKFPYIDRTRIAVFGKVSLLFFLHFSTFNLRPSKFYSYFHCWNY